MPAKKAQPAKTKSQIPIQGNIFTHPPKNGLSVCVLSIQPCRRLGVYLATHAATAEVASGPATVTAWR